MKTLVPVALVPLLALAPLVAAAGGEGGGNGIHCKPKWEAVTQPIEGTGTPLDGRAVETPTGGVECW